MSAYELDPLKDEANRRKHGLPLALGEKIFDRDYVEEVDDRFKETLNKSAFQRQ